nr:hypothetical protein 6 [Thermoactinomycetaceae bacterium]
MLKGTPHAKFLRSLYIGCNIIDPLTTKPADLSCLGNLHLCKWDENDSSEQKTLNRLVEDNNLNTQGYELVLGGGIRGDAWIKVMYSYQEDYSEYLAQFGEYPSSAKPEIIIEDVPGQHVFPVVSASNVKKFKAINIAFVTCEEVEEKGLVNQILNVDSADKYYLNVERHIPGWIHYYKYRIHLTGINNDYDGSVTNS